MVQCLENVANVNYRVGVIVGPYGPSCPAVTVEEAHDNSNPEKPDETLEQAIIGGTSYNGQNAFSSQTGSMNGQLLS